MPRGPNSKLPTDLLAAFETDHKTKVKAVHILPRTATAGDWQHASEEIAADVGAMHPGVETKVVRSGDIVTGLLRESKGADLIVMGGSEAGVIEQLLVYAPPLELAERTSTAVLTVYEMAAEPDRWMKE